MAEAKAKVLALVSEGMPVQRAMTHLGKKPDTVRIWISRDKQFAQDLALAINNLLSSPDKIDTMGKKSRERVEKFFSWTKIAHQTVDFYQELLE